MRIYYFVPEDGDEAAHPNAFSIPNVQAPTVAKIKESFPLKPNNGEYFLFRFKYKIKHAIKFVWLDVTADSAQAPRISTSSIFMKVSRMTIEDSNQEIVNQEDRSTAPAPAPAPSDDVDLFKLKTTEEKGAPAEQTTTPSSKDSLVSFNMDAPSFEGSRASSSPRLVSFSSPTAAAPEKDANDSMLDLVFTSPAPATAAAPASSPSKKDDGMFSNFNFSM